MYEALRRLGKLGFNVPTVQQLRAPCCPASEHPANRAAQDLENLQAAPVKSRVQEEAITRLSAQWAGAPEVRVIPPPASKMAPYPVAGDMGESGTLLFHKGKETKGVGARVLCSRYDQCSGGVSPWF